MILCTCLLCVDGWRCSAQTLELVQFHQDEYFDYAQDPEFVQLAERIAAETNESKE